HAIEACRLEGGALAENLGIGVETYSGAAPVVDFAQLLETADGDTARELLAIKLAAARDLDFETVGQRVDYGDADAVQAAGSLVDFRIELAARMQRRHDHFERRLVIFGVDVDGDTPAIVGDRQEAV